MLEKSSKIGRPDWTTSEPAVAVICQKSYLKCFQTSYRLQSLTDETDLVSLIRTIVREEVHRLVNQTQESLDSDPQSLEEIVQDELKGFWPQCRQKPTETRPRPTYAAVTRKYRAPVQKFPPQPRKQMCGERLTTDLFVSHWWTSWTCNALECRERVKQLSLITRNRRRNFDDVGTEEEIRRPNSSRRFTPSPTRVPILNTSLQIPVAISPIQPSPGRGARKNFRKWHWSSKGEAAY
ncbi:CCHC-type domain-containing protein [Trichonephila clavipes]|nr:CCHC-type domain-containing protein [Trichonephila clavipes]